MKKIFVKRGKLFVLGWLLVLLVPIPAQGQKPYTLPECLALVRSGTAASQQIDLDLRLDQIQQKIISKNYLPQATLGAKASWQSDVTSLPIELPGLDIPTVPREQFSLALDVNQMIFDGGMTQAFSEIKNRETDIKIAKSQSGILAWEKQGILLFYQIALQQKLLEISDLLISQLDQNIRQAESNLEAGILIKQDVWNIEVKKLEAVQQKREYVTQLQAASRSLAELMDTDDTLIAVVYPQQQTTGPQVTFDNRPELELVDLRRRLIAAQESLTVAEIQPKVNAFLTTGYGRPALNFLNDQFDFYAMAGIRIAVPLDHFYSRKIGLQKQSFRLEQESIQLDKADLVKRWSNEAVNYLEEMDKLRSWLKEDMEIIEMRQKILTIAQAQWEGGTLATAQYLNHISDLSLARIRLTTHEIMLEKTQGLLLNLIGASPDKN